MTLSTPYQRYSAHAIKALISGVLGRNGLPEAQAQDVARLMVEADLLGGDGHGVFRLPRYLSRIKAGGFNLQPEIRVDRAKGAMKLLDGDNAMGHLVMERAAQEAIALAKEFGTGWVGAHHSNHAGAAGVYAKMALEHDLIGLYLAVGNANHMAPWGGIELLLSTNPIAVAMPTRRNSPILLDMATTVAAYGKVKMAAQRGQTMPEGWMIDAEGNSLTDPTQAAGGSLLPIGGPKGYGLSLVFGLLAGTMNGAAMGRDVVDFNADDETITNTGQAILMIDPAVFGDIEEFCARVDDIIDQMRASALRPGFDSIRLPGERAFATYQDRSESGIPIPPQLVAILDQIADEHNVERLG